LDKKILSNGIWSLGYADHEISTDFQDQRIK
jgi:hypothetical protein